MKFLFDQSADFRLIPHLRHLRHDVQAVSRNYPPGLPDEEVLTIARKMTLLDNRQLMHEFE
jgi:hypothetical protein